MQSKPPNALDQVGKSSPFGGGGGLHKLDIAIIQAPLFWEDPKRNRKMFSGKIDKISKEIDLIVLPEMFTSGFTMAPENIDLSEGEKTVSWMLKMAKERNAAIVGSIIFYEGAHYFNRLFFAVPDGSI